MVGLHYPYLLGKFDFARWGTRRVWYIALCIQRFHNSTLSVYMLPTLLTLALWDGKDLNFEIVIDKESSYTWSSDNWLRQTRQIANWNFAAKYFEATNSFWSHRSNMTIKSTVISGVLCGKQLVGIQGLDLRLCFSGESILHAKLIAPWFLTSCLIVMIYNTAFGLSLPNS